MAGKNKNRKKAGLQTRIASVLGLVLAIIFMPTTILLFFGMIPTLIAGVVDQTKRGTKILTVGAMNLAGCTPFLLELWTGENSAEMAMALVLNPVTIIVIWLAAGVGYMLDWSVSGIVTTILIQRSESRLKDIQKRHAALIERWGREVAGDIPLDPYGFPLEPLEDLAAPLASGNEAKSKTEPD